jgi:hypothetical protein
MKKEIIFDLILKKFEGNKSFTWEDVHKKEFYEDIDRNYFVVENHLNFLIGDGTIKETNDLPVDPYLSLSRKGWFMMTNCKTEGYEAKMKKERRDKNLKIVLAILSVATFLLVGYRFYADFIKNKHTIESTVKKTLEKKTSNDSTTSPIK